MDGNGNPAAEGSVGVDYYPAQVERYVRNETMSYAGNGSWDNFLVLRIQLQETSGFRVLQLRKDEAGAIKEVRILKIRKQEDVPEEDEERIESWEAPYDLTLEKDKVKDGVREYEFSGEMESKNGPLNLSFKIEGEAFRFKFNQGPFGRKVEGKLVRQDNGNYAAEFPSEEGDEIAGIKSRFFVLLTLDKQCWKFQGKESGRFHDYFAQED